MKDSGKSGHRATTLRCGCAASKSAGKIQYISVTISIKGKLAPAISALVTAAGREQA
jgi:hypothetical protein